MRVLLAMLCVIAASTAWTAEPPDFTGIVKAQRDAVVNIATTQKVDQSHALPDGLPEQIPPDHPLRRFFKRFGGDGAPQQRRHTSLGSGFILSKDGYVLTNAHVIAEADEIFVQLADHRQLKAEVVGLDKRSDIGLLKVDGDNLPTVDIGNSKRLEVGQWVLAIGAPFGLEYTATQGIVSALQRSLPNDTYTSFIQTDVAVNPGNSGGPLFNLDGEVVGVNSQIFSRTGGSIGLSFAVPINTAMNVVEELKKDGKVERGYLGVTIQPVSRALAESFGLDKPVGALVAGVTSGGPAQAAGLKAGDVILRVNDQKIMDAGELPPLVGGLAPGSKVDLQIMRDGERRTVSVQLGALADYAPQQTGARSGPSDRPTSLNAAVRPLTEKEREGMGLEERGLLVQKLAPGVLASAGVRPGDILLSIGGHKLADVPDLKRAIQQLPPGKPVPVHVQREGRALFLTLTVPQKD